MQESSLQRDLSGDPVSAPLYTEMQTAVLQSLAFTFSLVSMIAVIVSFHRFLRMRRSFRHEFVRHFYVLQVLTECSLIMILMQSDMFKSLWFLIYAVASFLPGNVQSPSIFCQVSGFFTAVGIEASDFAVLMIAVHNALYIFHPPTSIGEGGLYPYRGMAFALWLTIPSLLAGLAFTNPSGAYQSDATACAFPVRPFWYRLALSWIPRYIIFVAILGIDISIYTYVHRKFGGLNEGGDSSLRRMKGGRLVRRWKRSGLQSNYRAGHSVPPTPHLAYNGLMRESRRGSVIFPNTDIRQGLDETQRRRSNTVDGTPGWIKATLLNFPHHSAKSATCSALPQFGNNINTATVNTAETGDPDTIVTSPPEATSPLFFHQPTAQTSWTTYVAQFSPSSAATQSTISFLSFLRLRPHHASQSQSLSGTLSQVHLFNSRGQNMTGMQLSPLQTRDRICQQLRFLFIYPLAYLGMWILPFVSHTLQYDDRYVADPPFALIVLVTIVMRSQCTINCLIFNAKERPWLHRAKDGGLLGQGIAFLRDVASGARTSGGLGARGGGGVGSGPGISRPAMAAEAMVAYQRRERERAARASEVGEAGRGERRERSWWDGLEREREGDGDLEEEGDDGGERLCYRPGI